MNQENETQTITVAAAVVGTPQMLEPFVEELKKLYAISDIEFNTKDVTSWVKCKIKDYIYIEYRKLLEIAMTDLNIKEESYLWNRKHKTRDLVFVRDILSFILRRRYNLSFLAIAKLIKAKNHASVLISCRKFRELKSNVSKCSIESAYTLCKERYKFRI